jgi:FG-GAP-like repeat
VQRLPGPSPSLTSPQKLDSYIHRCTAASIATGSSSRRTDRAWRSVDVDNDGWLDALVLSGTRLKDGMRTDAVFSSADASTNRLYQNLHNGHFEDVTDRAGLRRTGWASGVCAGDYDNDGWIDLYVTYFGSNVLYHNLGGGRFEDVTSRAGLVGKGVRWGSGCTFVDIDRDGRLDPFVANYLRFDLQTAPEPGSGVNARGKASPSTAVQKDCRRIRIFSITTTVRAGSATSRSAQGSRGSPGGTHDSSRRRPNRRRMAGHLRRIRFDGGDSLSQRATAAGAHSPTTAD